MTPALETGVAGQLARTAGLTVASKTLNHFDESGTADRLRSLAAQASAAGRATNSVAVPKPDADNLAAAGYLRAQGVDDRLLITAFQRETGFAFGSGGLPAFVGRDSNGEVRYLATLGADGGLHVAPGSDSRFGMHLAGESDRLAYYAHPVSMLQDVSNRMREGSSVSENLLAATDQPAECLLQFISTHPEVRQIEIRMQAESAHAVAAALEPLGFTQTEADQRLSVTGPIPIRPPEPCELPDGRRAVVTGEPQKLAEVLKAVQGDNTLGFQGTCGIVSCGNVMRIFGTRASEDELVYYAALRGLCDAGSSPEFSGATNAHSRSQLLAEWGLSTRVIERPSAETLARGFEEGHGVIVSVNAGILWDNANFYGNGFSNHAVTMTGTARDESGRLLGVYICDSGRRSSDDSARFVPIDLWRDAIDVPGGSANVTDRSRREEK